MMKTLISKKAVKWAATLCLVVSFPALVVAEGDADKVGSVAFKFLNIQSDARTAALGGLSAQGAGASALFSNPAGIAGSSMGISAGVNQWLVETNITNIGFVMPMAGGTVGLSVVSVDYGETMRSGWSGDADQGTMNLFPNLGDAWKASDTSLQLSYAVGMSDKFSIGGTVKMISQDIDGESISGTAYDVGMQFNTGYNGIRMGATISNFGPDVQPVDIPDGSSYEEFPSMSLPMTFNFGIVAQAFGDDNMGLVAGLNVAKYADMAQEITLNGEFSVAGLAKIRGSYNLDNPQFPVSFGAGISLAGIDVGLAMSSHNALGSATRITLGYSF